MATRPSPKHGLAFFFPQPKKDTNVPANKPIPQLVAKLVWIEFEYVEDYEHWVPVYASVQALMGEGLQNFARPCDYPTDKKVGEKSEFITFYHHDNFMFNEDLPNQLIRKIIPQATWRGPILVMGGFGVDDIAKYRDMNVGDMGHVRDFFLKRGVGESQVQSLESLETKMFQD